MKAFATLLDRLAFSPRRSDKLRLLQVYFRDTPDPDRGYALAALTGGLEFAHAKPALIRGLGAERSDEVLFALSYDYVGDLAETVALMWPEPAEPAGSPPLRLAEVVETLQRLGRSELPAQLAHWLDGLDADGRWALLKLITGGLRVGVSGRLARQALAGLGGVPVTEIEELWHALTPPYGELFAWLTGTAGPPQVSLAGAFRPVMLSHPLEEADLAALDARAFAAEWKWDGARVQLAAGDGTARLYSRSGDDITAAFPEVAEAAVDAGLEAVLDGELLIVRDGVVAPFADLQRRLNRKRVGAGLRRDFPAHVRVYDLLFAGDEDLRPQPFAARRARLEAWLTAAAPARFDLSPLLVFTGWDDLAAARSAEPLPGVEGLMLKRCDSPYLAGRVKGHWFKWKRDPFVVDAVLLYAQRGHGRRSSLFSDYTFGVWRDRELVPVGKAYFGFSDEELRQLDRWVRGHTVDRFGPVHQVTPALVLEIAFEGLNRSNRHKSGLAMRFPRISRIRWDKPAAEADRLAALQALLPG